ncbi:hypothetical protein, partial [Sphingomonas sp. CFBP 8760]
MLRALGQPFVAALLDA